MSIFSFTVLLIATLAFARGDKDHTGKCGKAIAEVERLLLNEKVMNVQIKILTDLMCPKSSNQKLCENVTAKNWPDQASDFIHEVEDEFICHDKKIEEWLEKTTRDNCEDRVNKIVNLFSESTESTVKMLQGNCKNHPTAEKVRKCEKTIAKQTPKVVEAFAKIAKDNAKSLCDFEFKTAK